MPCAVLLKGEYGQDGLFCGVLVKLGAKGVEQVMKLELNDEEKAMFSKSAAAVQELVDAMKKLA